MVFIGASNELGAFESGVAGQLLGPAAAVVLGGVGTLVIAARGPRSSPPCVASTASPASTSRSQRPEVGRRYARRRPMTETAASVAWSDDGAREIAERLAGERGALLPVLHAVQDEFGYVDARATGIVADELNLSRAEVHGVVTFYRDFRPTPPGGDGAGLPGRGVPGGGRRRTSSTHARRAARRRLRRDHARRRRSRSTRCSASATARSARPSRSTAGARPGRRRSVAELLDHDGTGCDRCWPAGPGTTVYVPARRGRALGRRRRGRGRRSPSMPAATRDPVRVVRNGSRGLLWLEPLVEVATDGVGSRTARCTPTTSASLFDAGFLAGGTTARPSDATDEIPWLARPAAGHLRSASASSTRSRPDDYEAHGGLAGLRRALQMQPEEVVAEVTDSGLRGRGGAGFPAGIKWRTVLGRRGPVKFVCCNADEGDCGTFADRMLMEGDPFTPHRGHADRRARRRRATEGYVYMRSEYPDAIATLLDARSTSRTTRLARARCSAASSPSTSTSGSAPGAYICGEETSMLESLEGKRGMVRAKPPLPALEGLFGRPTVVNNVLSLATVPMILADGRAAYAGARRRAVARHAGLPARRQRRPRRHRRDRVRHHARRAGQRLRRRHPHPAGRCGRSRSAARSAPTCPPTQFDLPDGLRGVRRRRPMVGHGGIVVFDDTVDMARQARFAMEFCAEESCGKCTPCRIGAVARRRGHRPHPRRRRGPRRRTSCCSTTCAR